MRGKLPALILAPLLLLGGCDAFFTNVFEGLYTLEVPSAAELGTLPVSDLERLAEDDQFFEELAGDPAKEAAVLDNLDDRFDPTGSDPADTPEEQKAAALYAEVLIRTSGADTIVAGLANFAAEDGFDELESGDIGAALADLFGESLPTLAEIEAMVAALDSAWDAYAAIGEGIPGGVGLDSSLNAGDLAFNAALAAALQGVTVTSGQSTAEYIFAAVQGDTTGFTATFSDAVLIGTEMDNLLAAAGIDPADLGL